MLCSQAGLGLSPPALGTVVLLGSSCATTPIQQMLNFCHFLPCKYFNVFKVI